MRTGVTFFAFLTAVVAGLVLWWDEPDSTDSPDAPSNTGNTVGTGGLDDGGQRGQRPSVVPAPFAEATGTGLTILGRVENASGSPVPDAPLSVKLHVGESTFGAPHTTNPVVADGEGSFSFTLPSGGAWSATVTSRVPGFVAADLVMSLRPDQPPGRAVLVLHPLNAERTVRTLDPDGRAISGVRLHIDQTNQVIHTDERGHARVRISRSFGPVWAHLSHKLCSATTRSIDAWRGEGPQVLEFVLGNGYAISGIASDPQGRPVSGVVVRLVGWTVVRTETDEQGRFFLAGFNPNRNNQRLTLRHEDYLPATVTAPRKGAGILLEVTLQRGLDVCGTVTGPDERPVMGALVTLGQDQMVGRSRRTTGARGEFCLGAPVRGELILRVSYPGLAPHLRHIHAEPDAPPLEIKLERGHVLGGRVVDEDGHPIRGATLSFHLEEPMDLGRWTVSDESGNWLVEGLPTGVVQLGCFEYGYIPVERKDIATGQRNLDVVMTRSGGIEGTVVDQTNQPITRFRIAFTPSVAPGGSPAARPPASWSLPGRLFESADGRFSSGRTPLSPNQAYRVEVSATGYATRVIEPYTPTLSPRNDPVKVVLTGGGGVSGRVTDAQNRGVANAVVAPAPSFLDGMVELAHGPRATTDATGAYTLRGLATGSVEIEARHARFAPVRRQVQIVRGQVSHEEDLVMRAAGSLHVDVRVDPADLGQTRVVLEPNGPGKRTEHPLSSNTLTLPWVLAGNYRISLASSRPDLDGLGTTVDIVAGRRRPIAFEPVLPTCDLRGHVTIDGRVPTNVVVDLVLSRINADGTRTRHANRDSRSDGSFVFGDLEPGRWHIAASFTRNGRRLAGEQIVAVEPGQPPVKIALKTN